MKGRLPDSYIIIFSLILIMGVLTYIIPSGEFERAINVASGNEYLVPDTFKFIKQSPLSPLDIINAVTEGMFAASQTIIFILLIGGSIGVILSTGIIDKLIYSTSNRSENKFLVISAITIIVSLASTVFGFGEEMLPFYPLVIMLVQAYGYKSTIAGYILIIGSTAGFTAGVMNPFNTGIAQEIVQLPLFSGILLRLVLYIVLLATGIIFILLTMKKHELDPDMNLDSKMLFNQDDLIYYKKEFTSRDAIALIMIIIAFLIMIVGIVNKWFYTTEITTVFITLGIVIGLLYGQKPGRIVAEFIKGSSSIVYSALIIGLASALLIVMKDGHVLDTIVYSASNLIGSLTPQMNALTMYGGQTMISFFIPSAAGQASVTLPIMKNIAELSNISLQTTVLAYQIGNGLLAIILPTNGILMAGLVLCDIDWRKWAKDILPLAIFWIIESMVIISIAAMNGYGPF